MTELQKKLTAHFEAFQDTPVAKKFLVKRKQSWEDFQQKGIPTIKNEEWKYTSLRSLSKKDYEFYQSEVIVTVDEIKKFCLQDTDTYKIVFVNGVYQEDLSEIPEEDIISILPFTKAVNSDKYNSIIESHLDTCTDKEEVMNKVNTAFFNEGAFVYIPKNVVLEKPIQVCHFYKNTITTFTQPRNLIVVEENSQATFFEVHQNLSKSNLLINTVTEIFVDRNSNLYFEKLQNNDTETTSVIDHTFVQQHKDSVATVNTFTFGGNITRNNIHFYQKEGHIISNLNGIVAIEASQHVDNHTLVHHTQPNCESHELYKGIYDGASTGVFNGKVLVNKEAQKLDAYQQNDNILIGDKASINSKPQLEIFADDVRCSHGCTIGELDTEALFYMQQRGIAKKEAEALLLYAFANEAIHKIKIPELKHKVSKLLAEKLNVTMEFYT